MTNLLTTIRTYLPYIGYIAIGVIGILKALHWISMGEAEAYAGIVYGITKVGAHFVTSQGTAQKVIEAMKADPAIPTNGTGDGK